MFFMQPLVFKFAFTCHFRVNLFKVFKKSRQRNDKYSPNDGRKFDSGKKV